ncbi:MAG: chorismate mutase [Candidatus Thorarchaeota archaeon]
MKEKRSYYKDLKCYRKKIDRIDDNIINLLNKRGGIVLKIGKIKKQAHINVIQPKREEEIIERMKLKSKVLEKTSVENIWREILEAFKIIQS